MILCLSSLPWDNDLCLPFWDGVRLLELLNLFLDSESTKRFSNSRSHTPSQNGRQRSLSQTRDGRQRTFSQSGYNNFRANRDRTKSPVRRQDQQYQDRSRTPTRGRPFPSVRCIGCKCNSYYSNKKTLQEIKDLLSKKIDVKLIGQDPPPTSVNLCKATEVSKDMVINTRFNQNKVC